MNDRGFVTGRGTRVAAGALAAVALVAAVLLILQWRSRIDPDPPAGPGQSSLPDLPPSDLNVSVDFTLDRLTRELDFLLPTTMGDLSERLSHPTNPRLSYAVETEREDLRLEARQDSLRITLVAGYRGRMWLESPFGDEITASCGTSPASGPAPRARIRMVTPLFLDRDWRVRSDLRVAGVEAASTGDRDRCEVALSFLSFDATDLVLEAMRGELEDRASQLDSLVAAFDIRSMIDAPWRRMREPFVLGEDVWLLVDPLAMRRGPIEIGGTRGDAVGVDLGLSARPRVVVGVRPTASGSETPSLDEGDVDEQFTLHLEARIDYPTASRLLEGTLEGRELQVAGRSVRITDAAVYGASDGRVAVDLGVDGAVRGRLFLVGRPVLDSVTQEITVPNLRFSAGTRNVLLRSAVWLADTAFPAQVRRYARWPFGSELARARSVARTRFDRTLAPGVRLEGDIGPIDVTEVRALPDGFLVRSAVEGEASIEIDVNSGSPE